MKLAASLTNLLLASALALVTFATSTGPVHAERNRPKPVLMVIANQDFYHREVAELKRALRAARLEVTVAAASLNAVASRPRVMPDVALADVEAEDYSAIVFAGGWGSAQYQYDFPGDYVNAALEDPQAAYLANDLIQQFLQQKKVVGAVCYGVSVLAYARVDGSSPIEGRTVTGWNGAAPGFHLDGRFYPAGTVPARWQIESHGATMALSHAVGDPQTSEDDVIVDGNIITAENFRATARFAEQLAHKLRPRR